MYPGLQVQDDGLWKVVPLHVACSKDTLLLFALVTHVPFAIDPSFTPWY